MDQSMSIQLSEEGADDERLEALIGYLRAELSEVEGADARRPHVEAPDGTRALDVIAVGGLIVSIIDSAAVRSVVSTIRRWLGRGHQASRTVRLEIDGDSIELSSASSEEQERLVEMFLRRHAPEGDEPWPATAKP